MPPRTRGIHHVTAVAGSARANVRFYTGPMGLRLVKRTVNFDDPGTWHLYYGDRTGSPGSILTFFPWEGVPGGRPGAGEVSATAYDVAGDALDDWELRLAEAGIAGHREERFGQQVLRLKDPDGTVIELAASVGKKGDFGPFHSVTLSVRHVDPTARVLTDLLGLEAAGEDDGRLRFRGPSSGPGAVVDLLPATHGEAARLGHGSVHHVAFRARDDDEQAEWREAIAAAGIPVTPVRDRLYFRSIYFREPGGVLFEIATDPPGFAVDEEPEKLGTELRLPPWLEGQRRRIEAHLPSLSGADGNVDGEPGAGATGDGT